MRYLQFAFRWMNNLLMREVPLHCTIRLWDTYQVSCPRGPRGLLPSPARARWLSARTAAAQGRVFSGVLVS